MKRKLKKGDAVKIGKFQPMDSMCEFSGEKGRVTKCHNKKGYKNQWIYDVCFFTREGITKTISFYEKDLKRRKETLICEDCADSFAGFDATKCPPCYEDSFNYD